VKARLGLLPVSHELTPRVGDRVGLRNVRRQSGRLGILLPINFVAGLVCPRKQTRAGCVALLREPSQRAGRRDL